MPGPIEIVTKAYCETCPDFSPVVHRHYGDKGISWQTVVCEHKELCERIYKTATADFIRKGNKNA